LEEPRVITWIRGGDLIDPVKGTVEQTDVLIEKGKISKMIPRGVFHGDEPGITLVEAFGKMVIPGLVDMHVHLREPGHEYKETIASGAMAAAAGGYTAIACMPNTVPPNDCRAVTEFILGQAERAGAVRVYPIAAISKGQAGETLTDFGELKEAGAVGLSDDGFPVVNSELMRRALEYASFYGLRVISHCEDRSLSGNGVMNEGVVSTRIGLAGIPDASEDIMVYREIALARLTGQPVHIAHVSAAASVDLIRRAKEDGIRVTAETAPHYFTLDHRRVIGYDTFAKVNPPLRNPEDVEAIKAGLREGVIDAIATDHAPHSSLEKDLEFDRAAFGMIGLQTALPLTLRLVRDGVLGLADAIGKLSWAGATLLGVPGGRLMEGGDADLAVIDLNYEYFFDSDRILSKSKNSPFVGESLKGIAELTMVGGKVVWEKR
jgi:dihydroorotase